ncbi:capping protein muscle Z-line, alpha 1 [Coemansia reversa NRRL 1564]|uniref:F-actin-capping protein subunit alpha n=1 Tax=Coemansia reversa (strain ATCC 12441 / NRRL 1564) TaxID=763665 RepID=A0A2G5B8L4_COERN|nr:capping protein muscle Z-line, alpha 1 [Coemansia reversa NRRL 1564]|eukprot:PIA15349.1 capping protein muscle Z-line, alpha 1 [Coemansia reversa NRRL 1564]
MSVDNKIAKAASLLLQSPPGEVDDVFNDIRGIVNDDGALQEHIEPVLAESNMQQFLIVDVPERQSKVLITPYNKVGETQYLDPRTRTVFTFDHLHRIGSEAQEAEETEDPTNLSLQEALQKELDKYILAHYGAGVGNVFFDEGRMITCIVSNRFSPTNFWNGSWRAVWSYDPITGELNGSAKVRVHYFEDGNVQLDTQTDFAVDVTKELDDDITARRVVKFIRNYEADFQQSIGDGYRQLAEKTFKGLRRTLPVTRTKMDWEKIANYKIGGELANAEN